MSFFTPCSHRAALRRLRYFHQLTTQGILVLFKLTPWMFARCTPTHYTQMYICTQTRSCLTKVYYRQSSTVQTSLVSSLLLMPSRLTLISVKKYKSQLQQKKNDYISWKESTMNVNNKSTFLTAFYETLLLWNINEGTHRLVDVSLLSD